ncbi:hypothetical protein, variant 2 [Exophiala mesophila]|nr:hypothetical protein, variant 2 [Exophiala mesophila]KIV89386.1 hypothetical protein, variant 2 [Exophiala mesophila]
MAYMVKNPGLIPGIKSIKAGDIAKRQKGMAEIMEACWRSCADLTEIEDEQPSKRKTRAFVAHAIIANPPSFAHIHCAEKLGIPLHLMFTMPWSPTQEFPQPIANIKSTAQGPSANNESSYSIVEMLTWQGLASVTNKFRRETLGLPELSTSAATTMIERLRVPYTYCWSPALIPKPKDWGSHIDVAGFYFLPLGSQYQPPEDLAEFLAAGEPPVYIGFGSIVVDDPDAMTTLIFDAVKKTGQRALVSKGWGGIGGDKLEKPDGVFMLGNCPHDWLFQHVSAVVHHGGAGTTAAGIALGRPTVIVPFFGDQPFWGSMVARAGAGPAPIHHKQLTADNLAQAILEALKPETLERAKELGNRIHEERGAETGAACFHQQLGVDRLRCALAPGRPAVWRVKTNDSKQGIRMSAFAATVLEHEGILDMNLMRVYRPHEWRPEEMITGKNISTANPVVSKAGAFASGLINYPVNLAKAWGGLATEPYKGAKKAGWRGFGKGLKTGVGGVLFPRRSLIGGRSYSIRAIYESMKERMDSETLSFILATRFAEGFEDLRSSTEEERADVIKQWHQLDPDLKVSKKKNKAHPWSKAVSSDETVKEHETRVEEPK